jgi:hypothetical protein
MTALDAGLQLAELTAERRAAISAGLGENALYMEQLDGEIGAVRAAYVGLAVTEIATLRAELGGAQYG